MSRNSNSTLVSFLPLTIIVSVIIIFFSKLLFGNQILITPDFGRSDALHLNLADKAELARALSDWQLPIWTDKLGTGFSLLGESQTGIFNLQNLIIFKFVPFPYSMSLSVVLIIIFTALGTYLFARSFSLSRSAATVGSLTFVFS